MLDATEKQLPVIFVSHVSPGAHNTMDEALERRLLAMLAKYDSVVLLSLYGDLSRNEVRVPVKDRVCSLVSGGLSPRRHGGPAVRRIDFRAALKPQPPTSDDDNRSNSHHGDHTNAHSSSSAAPKPLKYDVGVSGWTDWARSFNEQRWFRTFSFLEQSGLTDASCRSITSYVRALVQDDVGGTTTSFLLKHPSFLPAPPAAEEEKLWSSVDDEDSEQLISRNNPSQYLLMAADHRRMQESYSSNWGPVQTPSQHFTAKLRCSMIVRSQAEFDECKQTVKAAMRQQRKEKERLRREREARSGAVNNKRRKEEDDGFDVETHVEEWEESD